MAEQGWTLSVDGQVFREYDLTIDDLEAIETVTGQTWRTLHPLRSATIAKQITITLLVRRAGYEQANAEKVVGEMRGNDFLNSIGSYDPDADLPSEYQNGIPTSADETSTPT